MAGDIPVKPLRFQFPRLNERAAADYLGTTVKALRKAVREGLILPWDRVTKQKANFHRGRPPIDRGFSKAECDRYDTATTIGGEG